MSMYTTDDNLNNEYVDPWRISARIKKYAFNGHKYATRFFFIRNTTIRNIDLHCPKP